MTIEVTVLLFGPAREVAGVDRLRLTVKPSLTAADIIQQISEKYPALRSIAEHCVLAVGQQYRHHHEHLVLDTSTEIALIPPVSGG